MRSQRVGRDLAATQQQDLKGRKARKTLHEHP